MWEELEGNAGDRHKDEEQRWRETKPRETKKQRNKERSERKKTKRETEGYCPANALSPSASSSSLSFPALR